jgi:hypothetical protein
MAEVSLFYLTPNTTGGWVTFTCHLMAAFRAAGHEPKLYKVGNNTERKERPFGYECTYRNLNMNDAEVMAIETPTLIVAAAKNYKVQTENLTLLGSKIVVHDPTELKNLPVLDGSECVVIRRAGLEIIPGATFIRHPYQRQCVNWPVKSVQALSTARIDFDKNTHILLDANRILRDAGEEEIVIRGFENRLYTRFKICPEYPEWIQSVNHYAREKDAAVKLLQTARYMPDMSIIKGDGGGTQYTFLEAWDAGAVPIVHSEWLRSGDDMIAGVNCADANCGVSLATFLCDVWTEGRRATQVQQGYKWLENHEPALIGEEYAHFMEL